MTIPDPLRTALDRFEGALATLEAASARHAEAEARRSDAEAAMAALEEDRSGLAVALDGALARTLALEEAFDAISDHLAEAGATLSGLLEGLDSRAADQSPR